ncbi:hypothetical protein [Bradyrhizobium elkanii]|uniref:hypothetical protein n=1 Tax=Bradyrhizobium elkanii TaxID=29448 RepID=UPI000688824F|nr:hypothetical protein [Bradyrhizobium elkanii]
MSPTITEKSKEWYDAEERRLRLGTEFDKQLNLFEGKWSRISDIINTLKVGPLTTALENANKVTSAILSSFESLEQLFIRIGNSDVFKRGYNTPSSIEGATKPELLPQQPGRKEEDKSYLERWNDYWTNKPNKPVEDNTKATEQLTGKIDEAIKKQLPGYQPMSFQGGGGGGGFAGMVQQAAYSPGGGLGRTQGGAPMFGGGGGAWGGGGGGAGGGGYTSGAGGGESGGAAAFPGGGAGGAPNGSDVGGGISPAGNQASGNGEAGPAQALAFARQHLGEDEIRDQTKLSGFFRENGIKVNPATTAWCAAFVNSNLAKAGMKGSGSLVATSFLNYGSAVKPGNVQPGDIGILARGRSAGQTGGHVGFLTGSTRKNPRTGELEYEMLGGNQGGTASGQGGVSTQWRSASQITARRPDWDRSQVANNGQTAGPGGGQRAGDTPAGGKGGGGYLQEQRAPLMAELNDPAVKAKLSQLQAYEGGGAATVEALYNRVSMIRQKVPGYTLKDELNSRFYAMNKPGMGAKSISPAQQREFDKQVAAVGGGSNLIQGRTNQGMEGDPGTHLPGRVAVPGSSEVYNYWEGRRRGVEFSTGASAAFAARNQQAIADRAQVDRAQANATKVEGTGKISVDVNAPKGTKVGAEGGGLFKEVEVNRQTQMEPAKRSATNEEPMNI